MDRLYVDDRTPDSWHTLQERTVELLEQELISTGQTRALIYALCVLEGLGLPVPRRSGELYLMVRPVLERLPGGYG